MEFESWAKPESYVINRFANFNARIKTENKTTNIRRIAAIAASVILVLGFGGYFILHKQPVKQIVKQDNLPGKN